VEAGVIHGEGFGLQESRAGQEPWVAVTQRLAVRWSVPGIAGLGVWLEAGINEGVVRPRFYLDDVGSLHRPNALLWRAALGIEWQWALRNEMRTVRPL
jgi:hypothetical protein